MDYINDREQANVKEYGEFIEYLQAKYDNRASFYKKAKVLKYNGALYLQSYDTSIAKVENCNTIINGWFSQTTARHINEFLYQLGFNKMTKKEMEGN